ncbi:class I SAM-dependent methyltransferase [Parvularcula sp. LCG005]|uniref:class I SAM-dependent methyltransferase n=1 Tax=Parvularcula sp. LCG005 TaxID=3078805 RepID=UPI002941D971|nr:methyltransferase domain-containing protein [Parvularcula sp. LCG005]WOI54145.1 methyltransferase domain-containing protein [Parvularcula sp. LCG005]
MALSWWRALFAKKPAPPSKDRCCICGQPSGAFEASGTVPPGFSTDGVVGLGQRENDLCPSCSADSRERLLFAYVERFVRDRRPASVLHVRWREGQANWLGKLAKDNVTTVTPWREREGPVHGDTSAELLKLPFNDGAFDLIVCADVMQRVSHDRRALIELGRVLAPSGMIVVQVPYTDDGRLTDEDSQIIAPEDRIARFGDKSFVRLYALNDFRARIGMAGLETSLYDAFADDEPRATAQRLHPSDRLILVGRPATGG